MDSETEAEGTRIVSNVGEPTILIPEFVSTVRNGNCIRRLCYTCSRPPLTFLRDHVTHCVRWNIV